jgi:hypothetical protein
MNTVDLRVAEKDWVPLRQLLDSSFRQGFEKEAGALGILGECRTEGKREFIIVKIFPPGPGDIKYANSGALVFDSSYIRRAHLAMRSERLAGLVTFHTHPFSDRQVNFSRYDLREDPLLIENLQEMELGTRLLSVVIGKQSHRGRLWNGPCLHEKLRELIVVGERVSFLPLNGAAEPPPPHPEEIFDRGLALTGAGALNRLSKIRVAVVGASGTGSLVCELLARAGCRRIMTIDDDIAKSVNLNRILHATSRDVLHHAPKVEVLKQAIERLGLRCRVESIYGNILDTDVMMQLREADVIFGCVDKALPRKYLSEFAYRYCRPYIDVGSEIGGDDRGIVCITTRTSYIAPGRHCLLCSGIVTPRQLHFESLSADERQRTAAMGYSDDLVLEQPAVMDLNMRAASCGMMVLRHLLQPFLLTPLPVTISENLVTYTTIPIQEARDASASCRICQVNAKAGYGDCGPPIGMDKATVAAIRKGEKQ